MDITIEVSGLKIGYGEKTVLDGIDLQAARGEILGLLGPSGAGKTTLLKVLTGQLTPWQGESRLLGIPSSAFSGEDYKRIGIMMDSFGLYERLSCRDNLRFYAMLRGTDRNETSWALEKVGLGGAAKTLVSNLSKGMRSRLLLARSLLGRPEALFLDEPTSGLDPTTAEDIHSLILEERERGTTVFLTTHNMAEAQKLCDHVALLNEGRIVEYGSPREICRKYNHQKKLVLHLRDGEDIELPHGASAIKDLVYYMETGRLETIHSTEPDLETVFLELTGRSFE